MKYELIYIFEHATLPALHGSLEEWFERYNHWHPYKKLGNLTTAAAYQSAPPTPESA